MASIALSKVTLLLKYKLCLSMQLGKQCVFYSMIVWSYEARDEATDKDCMRTQGFTQEAGLTCLGKVSDRIR